jgi:hypothetical protein
MSGIRPIINSKSIIVLTILFFLIVFTATGVFAIEEGSGGGGGEGIAGATLENSLNPSFVKQIKGDYVAAGVGMRGTGAGSITIREIPANARVTNAFLYWAIIGANNDPEPIMFRGNINGTRIKGELIGTDTDPCWDPSVATFAFRTNVTSLVTGNGTYTLSGFASGAFFTPPLNEGASLVIIYEIPNTSGLRNVVINDGADTIDAFNQGVSTVMHIPPIGKLGEAKTTFIVADGQDEFPDSTVFNGTIIATDLEGLGGMDSFEGSDGQFWDTDTYDVTSIVSSGDSSISVGISVPPFHDCLVHIAQVFSSPARPTR